MKAGRKDMIPHKKTKETAAGKPMLSFAIMIAGMQYDF